MTWLKHVALAATMIAVTSHSAAAQGSSWRELLEDRVRTAYRYTHPPSPGECDAAQLPATGYLVTPAHSGTIGRTWLPGPNQSHWEPVRGPSRPDTLEVRMVSLWCRPSAQSLLVEVDGYYLEIDAMQLARIDETSGQVTPGVLLGGAGAGSEQLALREVCTGGSCQLVVMSADAYVNEVRATLADRDEAERVRQAEAQRRADSQAVDRARAAANVGAQAAAITQRQLIETFQEYGATEEQARAILSGRVLVGMTPAMVRAAVGEPGETRQVGSGQAAVTTWVYRDRQIDIVAGRVTQIR
jgi:hypothetical protein